MAMSLHCKLLTLFVVLTVVPEVKGNCPSGWWQFIDQCYLFGKKRVTWNEAKYFCSREVAMLASIFDERVNKFIQTGVAQQLFEWSAWIGGSDQNNTGNWRWLAKRIRNYTNWKPGALENKGDNDRCVVIETTKGYWLPKDCNEKKNYVCETFARQQTC